MTTLRFRITLLGIFCVCLAMLFGGCQCTEDVNDTASKVTGESDVKQYKQIQKDLEGIQQQRKDQSDQAAGK
jgi:hypothetical protein